jgi:GT2 family glycosyltransferase
MNRCYLSPRNGAPSITMRRSAAIGDCIMALPIAQKLSNLGLCVVFQTMGMIAPIIRRCPWIDRVTEPTLRPDLNLDDAREAEKENRDRHFCETFFDVANRQLGPAGIYLGAALNCRPVLRVRPDEKRAVEQRFIEQGYLKPWIFLCPRSDSWRNRQVPDWIWATAALKMPGTKFWLGTHPAPVGIVDVRCDSPEMLPVWLCAADLLVTVDTGPMHIAAALGVPAVVILQASSPEMHLSDQRDWVMVGPHLPCLHCMEKVCPKSQWRPPCQEIDPDTLAGAVNSRVNAYSDGKVSCLIPTYQPPAQRLNAVLDKILPQVDEVIVTRAADAQLPVGLRQDQKIRHIVKNQRGIGFGRNVNYGFRHTRHEWVLLLNDDCHLNPGAVAAMRAQAKPDTGAIAPLLRRPDGRIYSTYQGRDAGADDWHYLDHGEWHCRFREPVEIEKSCGCCLLIRRQAFYEAGCFDEDYLLYAEDDALAMEIRRAGWKILFVPEAMGMHEVSQTASRLPNVQAVMQENTARFYRSARPYIAWNKNRVPLGNFDYLRV